VLLERQAELTRIDEALGSACAGTGVLLVIEGEPGIGKTTLVAAARGRAAALGMTVLSARGTELETDYPFGAVRQCLESAVRSDQNGLLAGAAALAAPVVIDVPPQGVAVSAGVLHGLYWLMANLCERGPLLLAADDAHWVDEPSLRFLAYLAARMDSLPAAVVIATRPVDGGTLDELVTQRVELTGLHAPAVSEYLSTVMGLEVDATFARACHRATAGNPFLLTELARTLQEDAVPLTAASAPRIEEDRAATGRPRDPRATGAAGPRRSLARSRGRGARR
jgi:predicted ATPase